MSDLAKEIRESLKPHRVEGFAAMCYPIPNIQQVEQLIAEVERLTTSAKAWELQAKGYAKVITRLESALTCIIKTRCKMLEPCVCCDADAKIAREALNPVEE